MNINEIYKDASLEEKTGRYHPWQNDYRVLFYGEHGLFINVNKRTSSLKDVFKWSKDYIDRYNKCHSTRLKYFEVYLRMYTRRNKKVEEHDEQ